MSVANPMKDSVSMRGIVEFEHFDAKGNVKGKYTFTNAIKDKGKSGSSARLIGTSVAAFGWLAIGTGTPTSTLLGAEITTGGGGRAAATTSQVTTTVTNDTAQFVYTWTFSSSFAVTEVGVFNIATANTQDCAAATSFTAINVVSSDTLKATYKIIYG